MVSAIFRDEGMPSPCRAQRLRSGRGGHARSAWGGFRRVWWLASRTAIATGAPMARDIVVIGGGLSGLAFAAHASRAGRSVVLLEARDTAGGCLATRPGRGGFWIELGAHTCYNSYSAFLDLLEKVGLFGELQARGKPVLRFLEGDRVVPGKNLGA